jgi:hypothetical protein
MNGNRNWVSFSAMLIATIATLLLFAPPAGAQYTYQLDGWTPDESGNYYCTSISSVPQDILMVNSFTVVSGAQTLTSLEFLAGFSFTSATIDQVVTAVIYTGSSLTDPQAGSGLQRIVASTHTVIVPLLSPSNFLDPWEPSLVTVPLASPVTLPVGQIFYAGLLFASVGEDEAPYGYDANPVGSSPPYVGQSFEGYGLPTYNIDDYSDLNNDYVPGNIVLRVNAVPEPGFYALVVSLGVTVLGLRTRYRRRTEPETLSGRAA